VDLAWLLLLFPSSPAVKITITCNKSKTHKQQLILSFFVSCSRICFLSLLLHFGSASLYRYVLFFSFPILLCLRWRQDHGGPPAARLCVSVRSVQLSVVGSCLGEDDGLQTAPFRLEGNEWIGVNGLWGCCPLAGSGAS